MAGKETFKFREKLLKSKAPETNKELQSKIAKPEGFKHRAEKYDLPLDEGFELFGENGYSEEQEETRINDEYKLSNPVS